MSIRIISQNPYRIWDPPVFPRAPPSTATHCIIPLKCFACSQSFISPLENNQLLVDKISATDYQNILSSANILLKRPILWYIISKCGLTFLSFVASVVLIISLIFISFIWTGVSAAIVLLSFFCIRECGNQYFKAMCRLRNKISEVLEQQQEKYLSQTNVKIFCGEYCNWLDFTTNETEVVEENPIKTFHIFTPGTVHPKGIITMPLL